MVVEASHEEAGGLVVDIPERGHDGGHAGCEQGPRDALHSLAAGDPPRPRAAAGQHDQASLGEPPPQHLTRVEDSARGVAGSVREQQLREQRVLRVDQRVAREVKQLVGRGLAQKGGLGGGLPAQGQRAGKGGHDARLGSGGAQPRQPGEETLVEGRIGDDQRARGRTAGQRPIAPRALDVHPEAGRDTRCMVLDQVAAGEAITQRRERDMVKDAVRNENQPVAQVESGSDRSQQQVVELFERKLPAIGRAAWRHAGKAADQAAEERFTRRNAHDVESRSVQHEDCQAVAEHRIFDHHRSLRTPRRHLQGWRPRVSGRWQPHGSRGPWRDQYPVEQDARLDRFAIPERGARPAVVELEANDPLEERTGLVEVVDPPLERLDAGALALGFVDRRDQVALGHAVGVLRQLG
jgi:hypothetical protein